MNNSTIRYLILDDVELTRDFLANVISDIRPDFELAGVVEEAAQSVRMFRSTHPDLIFSKFSLSDSDVIGTLSRECPTCPVVLISEYEQSRTNPTGIRLVDYLLEPITAEDIYRALARFEKLTVCDAVPVTEQAAM